MGPVGIEVVKVGPVGIKVCTVYTVGPVGIVVVKMGPVGIVSKVCTVSRAGHLHERDGDTSGI